MVAKAVSTGSGFVWAERVPRPSPPRLPELAGMTEAGFNRVVAMIQPWDFNRARVVPGIRWGPGWNEAAAEYNEWRASLPKARNKKQRKAANVPRWTEEDIRKARDGASVIDAFFEPTPLQRLLKFAAEDGTPVSFEIAEKAMKGGG